MRHFLIAALAALFVLPAMAEGEFAADSKAKSWNLTGEEKARFSGKVVDILCELTGDCPDNCGDGGRQLGLIRDADGKLVLLAKNAQAAFTGAVRDMLPYCNQNVKVDGLLVGDPEVTPAKFYLVQKIQPEGEAKWVKANKWTRGWAKDNPDLKGIKGAWFRKDTRIKALIERNGWLGLGLEIDKAFLEYYFE